jgi:hypothetical protein
MAVEFGRLKTTLANSKLQQENNAAYQTILGLIDEIQKLRKEISALQLAVGSLTTIISTGGDDYPEVLGHSNT